MLHGVSHISVVESIIRDCQNPTMKSRLNLPMLILVRSWVVVMVWMMYLLGLLTMSRKSASVLLVFVKQELVPW